MTEFCGVAGDLDFKNMSWLFPTDSVKNLAVVVDDNLSVWRGFTSHVIQIAPCMSPFLLTVIARLRSYCYLLPCYFRELIGVCLSLCAME